jgi:RTA1 like protein
MPSYTCYDPKDPNSLYSYCPSFGAAVAFSCFFGLVTIAHTIQATIHKKPFSWVLIMGCLWECAGYIFRTLGVTDQKQSGYATAQFLLILLAPLWINAFVYMLLGRMVQFFLDDRRIYGIKAKHFTWIFVSLDILSFLVQLTGGSMASGTNPPDTVRTGLHIYMGGIGLQEFIILIFTTMAYRFQQKVKKQEQSAFNLGEGVSMTQNRSPHQARKLLWLVYTVLGLITLRIIFRLVEFSQGFTSYLPTHEWFPYVFDAVPMLAATLAFNILHPGRILQGLNSDFSEERKADKRKKREKKEVRRGEKERRKAEKKEAKQDKKGSKKGAAAGSMQEVRFAEV